MLEEISNQMKQLQGQVEDFQKSEVFKYAEDSYTKVYMELMALRQHLRSEVASHNEEL